MEDYTVTCFCAYDVAIMRLKAQNQSVNSFSMAHKKKKALFEQQEWPAFNQGMQMSDIL